MADGFIVRRGGAGGGNVFAFIVVTYPAGSTCTCTNGTKTLTAKDTSGSYVFEIPSAGTWTVSCTDGTKTAEKKVTISYKGQSESVALYYLVPAEYQAVEYLQSSGTQFINTEISRQTNLKVHLKMATLSNISSDATYIGARDNSSGDTQNNIVGQYQSSFSMVHQGTALTGGTPKLTANTQYELVGLWGSSVTSLTVNGNSYYSQSIAKSYTSSTPMYLFARRNGTDVMAQASIRVYSCILEKNNIKLREFVPCYRKSDNVAGMWDKVTETFFTNKGSGTFIVGGLI